MSQHIHLRVGCEWILSSSSSGVKMGAPQRLEEQATLPIVASACLQVASQAPAHSVGSDTDQGCNVSR